MSDTTDNAKTATSSTAPVGDNRVFTQATATSADPKRWIDNLLFSILCVLIFGLAIPFAGVEIWVKMTFVIAIALVLIAWSLTRPLMTDPLPAPIRRLWAPGLCLLVVMAWGWLQVVHISVFAHPDWQFAANTLQTDLKSSISIDRSESLNELIFLMTLGAIFWLTLQLGRDPKRARLALIFFIGAVTVNAAYGAASSVLGWDYVLWERKQDYITSATGTFVNRNSFATYLGLALIAALALTVDKTTSSRYRNMPWKKRASLMLNNFFGKSALPVVAIFILATALMLTQSRAGNLAFVVGLVATLAAFTASGKLRLSYTLGIGALLLIPALIIFSVSGDDLVSRLDVSGEELSSARVPLFIRAWEMIAHSPVSGVGLGNFRLGFFPYLDDTVMVARTWQSAHSTYLDLMSELGIVFAAALFVGIILLILDCWRGLKRRRRNTVFAVIGIGTTVLVAVHALVDFSTDMPAVAAAYTFLLALGVSQSAPTRTD